MTATRLILGAGLALLLGCAAQSAQAGASCYYEGTKFSDGGASCQGGRQYRCNDGEWLSTTQACETIVIEPVAARSCDYGGLKFSPGSASCQAGTQYRCDDGKWMTLGTPCRAGDAPIKVNPSGDICMFGGATVASGSTICQSGETFLCNDGSWVNLGTTCR